jgi:hypothetical protein
MPSERNTAPTASRMSSTATRASVVTTSRHARPA